MHTMFGHAFSSSVDLLAFASLAMSVPVDYRVKSTGMGHANSNLIRNLPLLINNSKFRGKLFSRSLVLNCLTSSYAELWNESWVPEYSNQKWLKDDHRLEGHFWKNLGSVWKREFGLRIEFQRRQALIELDVLAARELGLSLGELLTIYRIQFPVLRNNDLNTWFDHSGRIIFTCNRGLPGVGLPRTAKKGDKAWSIDAPGRHQTGIALGWEDVRDLQEGVITRTIMDDTLPGGPKQRTITYTAPFDRCDREADYRTAWEMLENSPG